MLSPSQRFTRPGWYLSPGPLRPDGAPLHTIDVDELAEYDYPVVAEAILSLAGTRCVHPPNPKWDDWRGRWQSADGRRHIEVDMAPDWEHFLAAVDGRPIWSGGLLECDCTVGDLAEFLRGIRERCPGVWLCDGGDYLEAGDSRLHTPESFLAMASLRGE